MLDCSHLVSLSFMTLSDYFQFLEPVEEQINNFYSVASLVVTLLIALWLFNFVVGLIQRTYSIGKICGRLYRNYFHQYIRASITQIIMLFGNSKKLENTQ
tara:strand:+ start:29 stop:328 length:300 start_codon:yes stop_codon:yes gene_type:complete